MLDADAAADAYDDPGTMLTNAPASIFESYEGEFNATIRTLPTRITRAAMYEGDAMKRREDLQAVEVDLGQVESLLRQMEVEARGAPSNERGALKARCRQYKESLNSIKRDFRTAKEKGDRDALMARDGVAQTSGEHRGRLTDQTARLEASSDLIEQSQRTILETEQVALGITDSLSQQRSTILSAHSKVRTTGGLFDEASTILHRMKNRACRRKCYMWTFVLIMLAVLIAVIAMESSSSDEPTQAPTPAP